MPSIGFASVVCRGVAVGGARSGLVPRKGEKETLVRGKKRAYLKIFFLILCYGMIAFLTRVQTAAQLT